MIDYSQWYEAIPVRRSWRKYDPLKPVPDDLLAHMRTFCSEFRPFPHARAEMITGHCNEIFKGLIGSYGKIRGASYAIAFIGDMNSDHVQEQTGYLGEGIILEASCRQLATCWVAGFFRPDVVASLLGIGSSEKVLAVTPLGYAFLNKTRVEKYMAGMAKTHERKPLSEMVTGLQMAEWAEWIKLSIEAARLAPSAINRQPWGFHVEPDAITVSVRTHGLDFTVSKRLDCGIAMLHIQAAASKCGITGNWEFLKPPDVARFKADSKQK